MASLVCIVRKTRIVCYLCGATIWALHASFALSAEATTTRFRRRNVYVIDGTMKEKEKEKEKRRGRGVSMLTKEREKDK